MVWVQADDVVHVEVVCHQNVLRVCMLVTIHACVIAWLQTERTGRREKGKGRGEKREERGREEGRDERAKLGEGEAAGTNASTAGQTRALRLKRTSGAC